MKLDKTKYGWWKNAVFYQIYPKSFQDTNGDGVGDLPRHRGAKPPRRCGRLGEISLLSPG